MVYLNNSFVPIRATHHKQRNNTVLFSTKLLTAAAVLIIIISGCAETKLPLSEEELLRKELRIKTITKWNDEVVNQVQHFDEYGRKIAEKWQNPKGFVVSNRELQYDDETGNLDEVLWYRANNIKKSRHQYFYDEHGNMTKEHRLTPSGNLRTEIKYTYEGDIRTRAEIYGGRGNLMHVREFRYDNEDNLIEFIENNRHGELNNRQEYDYDDQGRKIKERWYNKDNELTTVKKYKYEDGLLVEEVQYDEGDIFRHRVLREYDDNGLLLSENWLDEEGNTFFANQFTFEYH